MHPKIMLILTENWTIVDKQDLRTLVDWAVIAEEAGIYGLMLSDHITLGSSAGERGIDSGHPLLRIDSDHRLSVFAPSRRRDRLSGMRFWQGDMPRVPCSRHAISTSDSSVLNEAMIGLWPIARPFFTRSTWPS